MLLSFSQMRGFRLARLLYSSLRSFTAKSQTVKEHKLIIIIIIIIIITIIIIIIIMMIIIIIICFQADATAFCYISCNNKHIS